jgi:phospholipase C
MAIEHVVVLCLENRSFDHMLGFLDHPDPSFDGLLGGNGPYANSGSTGISTEVTPDAKGFLPYGPDHSHNAVMSQLALEPKGADGVPTNAGFVASYELRAAGHKLGKQGGLVGWAKRQRKGRAKGPAKPPSSDSVTRGALLMRCQPESNIPVLSTLAKEFAVCDSWFCSVPGETWPNRNFLHAASSDGETTIKLRPYRNPTIFESIEKTKKHDWRIYHDDTPQVLCFPDLWDSASRHAKWFPIVDFAAHVQAGELPAYTFIEPDHTPPPDKLDVLQKRKQGTGRGDSQHPDNNVVSAASYDTFVPEGDIDFTRGEGLMAWVYECLRANPELFAKTVLLITYDEYGGFYDHAVPSQRVKDPGRMKPTVIDRVLFQIVHEDAEVFDFTRVGVRVPTVIVSPLIERGTVLHDFLEHASVPATLRALFAPGAKPLTVRDEEAATFHRVCDRVHPRDGTDLPDLSEHTSVSIDAQAQRPSRAQGTTWMPPYFKEFLGQADVARKHLMSLGEYEATGLPKATTKTGGVSFMEAFKAAARRHRAELGQSHLDP